MRLKTLPEMYADLIAGKYTGSPGVLWNNLSRDWLDIDIDDDGLYDAIERAVESCDHVGLLTLCDGAEAAGVGELCDLTRRALRVQYPATWTHDEILSRIERLEAECSAELPDLSDTTLRQRVQRLLDSDDRLTDADADFLRRVVES